DQRRDILLGRTVDDPVQLAGVRVVAGDTQAAGEDELFLAGRIHDDRGAVRSDAIGPVGPPAFFAGLLVQGDEIRLSVLVAVEDEHVLVKDRRGAEAVARVELAGGSGPHQLAGGRVAGDDHLGDLVARHIVRLARFARIVFARPALADAD